MCEHVLKFMKLNLLEVILILKNNDYKCEKCNQIITLESLIKEIRKGEN
ncbi:MAG: hypothetical protein ACRDD7_14670 [Peptostreptococcaceae bacterium]